MKIENYEIPGLLRIELDLYRDDRGFFVERYHQGRFEAEFRRLGLEPPRFVQTNHSRSAPRVLRGLHAQSHPRQAKLVSALSGRIWDVAVDLRLDSPTYGRYASIELDGASNVIFYIPGGFAHGFCVLGDETADVLYQVDQLYDPKTEIGVAWNDPALAIAWPVRDPLISPKDSRNPHVSSISGWAGL